MLKKLNCVKDYKRYIHISYHNQGFIQQKKTKFTMEQLIRFIKDLCFYSVS